MGLLHAKRLVVVLCTPAYGCSTAAIPEGLQQKDSIDLLVQASRHCDAGN